VLSVGYQGESGGDHVEKAKYVGASGSAVSRIPRRVCRRSCGENYVRGMLSVGYQGESIGDHMEKTEYLGVSGNVVSRIPRRVWVRKVIHKAK
jgi:hypothetical protein